MLELPELVNTIVIEDRSRGMVTVVVSQTDSSEMVRFNSGISGCAVPQIRNFGSHYHAFNMWHPNTSLFNPAVQNRGGYVVFTFPETLDEVLLKIVNVIAMTWCVSGDKNYLRGNIGGDDNSFTSNGHFTSEEVRNNFFTGHYKLLHDVVIIGVPKLNAKNLELRHHRKAVFKVVAISECQNLRFGRVQFKLCSIAEVRNYLLRH